MREIVVLESEVYELEDFVTFIPQNLLSESYAKHRRFPQRYEVKAGCIHMHPILVVPRKLSPFVLKLEG